MHMSKLGVSMIEVVVYLGLFSILLSGAVVAAHAMFQSSGRNIAKAMVEEEGNFLVGKIQWALSGVSIVNTPLVGEVSSNLTVTKYDNSLVTLSLPPGGVMMIQVGATTSPLNNANTSITALTFTHIGASSDGITPEGVIAEFSISATTPNGAIVTRDFSTTKYLRK